MHDIFWKNILEGGPKLIIGVCPLYMSQRVVHKINYRSMSTIYASEGCPQSKQIDLFGNNFHTWQKHV